MVFRIGAIIFLSFLTKFSFSQEPQKLTSADSLFISYQLIKSDSSDIEYDNYLLEIFCENKSIHDLVYFVAQPSANDIQHLTTSSFAKIEVANTNAQIFELYGDKINLKTDDGKLIYLIAKEKIKQNVFNVSTKKGVKPIVIGSINKKLIRIETIY